MLSTLLYALPARLLPSLILFFLLINFAYTDFLSGRICFLSFLARIDLKTSVL